MSLPILIFSVLIGPLGVLLILLQDAHKKSKKLQKQMELLQADNSYAINLLKEIQVGIDYENAVENAVEIIKKNLDQKYPHSAISSLLLKDGKLIFKSQVLETVSHAYLDHLKDTMVQTMAANTGTGGNTPISQSEIIEEITGTHLDDLGISTLKSSYDIKIVLYDRTEAIINISSMTPNLYSPQDTQTFDSISGLVSGLLTRTKMLFALEKSKSLSMIDSFSEGIFMIDKENKLSAINDSALKFLNIHKNIPDISDILSALPNTYNFKEKITQVITAGETIEEKDVNLNEKTFKIIITPVLEINNPNKNIIGASFLLKDTTLEKSMSQMKEDFTNIMVHELRSPLTAIRASSEFLTSQADLTQDEKSRLVRMISDSSKKMLDKISLILDSAKMDAGLFAIRKTPSDIKKLITDRVAIFTQAAAEKSITIAVNVDPALPNFSFDPIRIDEVVNNLISNSLKFTPNGGTITIKAIQDGENVTVSVSDTGGGIPKEKQHLLFSKYVQAPSGGEHQGTGLGLYVVKGVTEAHGGKVILESNDGKSLPAGRQGTTISFTLPLSDSKIAMPTSLPTPPHTMSN